MKNRALIAFALASLLSPTASAQEITWTTGFVQAPGSSYLELLKTVPDRILAATNGRLKIELYDTLVQAPEFASAVREGRLDAAFIIVPFLSAESPILNFGSLPGLITEIDQYHKMLDPLLRAETAAIWTTKYNAQPLLTGVFETQSVISRDPIQTVEDFAGKKIRVHNPQAGQLMTQVGAAPVALPVADIIPGIERGIVDVVMTSVGFGNQFATVAKNVSLWKVGTIVTFEFVVNKETCAKLPDDLKPIVEQELRKIEDEHFAGIAAYNEAKLKGMTEKGMVIYNVPDSELEKLFSDENVKAVYDNWYALNTKAGTDGHALVEKIKELDAKL